MFVGRQRELATLRADVAGAGLDTLAGRPAARSRVLLIAGRPGSGRSTLAAELARQVAPDYPGGVLHARLTTAGGVPVPTEHTARRLLRAMGEVAPPGAAEEELAAAVRARLADRRTLLLLDDVQQPDQLLDLLPDTRGCLVVATSRGPLTGVTGVRPCTLGGLDEEAAVALLVQAGAGEVRVAVDPRAAEALVAECAAQPTPLVLVAGWLAAHPQASLADALLRLRQLAGEPLERALTLVHGSLPTSAARLLDLLTLVPDGRVDAQLASALVGCPAAVADELLELLVRRGLLHPEPRYVLPGCLEPLLRASLERRHRPETVLLARARMLERLVRQLYSCWARVQPHGSAARRRAAALPARLRFGTPAAAAAWLTDRLPSLLTALRLTVEDGTGELDTLARRLAAALARALVAHQGVTRAGAELYEVYTLVRAVARRRGLHREEAAVELALGDLDAETGHPARAESRYRAALHAARAARDSRAHGRALESLGDLHRAQGDLRRAADWYGRARELYQAGGELAGEARTHGVLGEVHAALGEWTEAVREWRAAAAVHRRRRDVRGCARALGEVARAQYGAGRHEEARRACREALQHAQRCGDRVLLEGLQRLLWDLR